MNYATSTIETYLTALASRAPAPGGGSVAALTAAQGAGLVAMVASLTHGRPRYARFDTETAAVLAEANQLRTACQAGIDDDAKVLASLMATYQLPRSSPEEKRAREARLQAALLDAALVPHALARNAASIVPLCLRLLPIANPSAISDLGVAALCASVAFRAAELNVAANLQQLADRGRAGQLAADVQSWGASLDRDVAAIYDDVRRRFS